MQLHHQSTHRQQAGCHHAHTAPMPHGYTNGCQEVIYDALTHRDTHWQCHTLQGECKNGGGGNKIGHKYNKSGTDCVNNVYYII